jgi:hypothetical protein
MFQPFAKIDSKLRIGLWVALALAALFAATAIPWLSVGAGPGAGAFLGATAMLWLPYFALYSLLVRAKEFPRFQVICFVGVTLPALLLPFFRLSTTPMGGWEFFIVPFWQLVLHAIFFYILKALEMYSGRNTNEKSGSERA